MGRVMAVVHCYMQYFTLFMSHTLIMVILHSLMLSKPEGIFVFQNWNNT